MSRDTDGFDDDRPFHRNTGHAERHTRSQRDGLPNIFRIACVHPHPGYERGNIDGNRCGVGATDGDDHAIDQRRDDSVTVSDRQRHPTRIGHLDPAPYTDRYDPEQRNRQSHRHGDEHAHTDGNIHAFGDGHAQCDGCTAPNGDTHADRYPNDDINHLPDRDAYREPQPDSDGNTDSDAHPDHHPEPDGDADRLTQRYRAADRRRLRQQ